MNNKARVKTVLQGTRNQEESGAEKKWQPKKMDWRKSDARAEEDTKGTCGIR